MEINHGPSNDPPERAKDSLPIQTASDSDSTWAEAADILKQAQLQRRRIWHIRRQLQKRWHRAWAHERSAFQQRQDELSRRHADMEKESESFQQQQAAFNQERLHFHSEMAFSNRQIQADRADIQRQQQQLTLDRRSFEQKARELAEKERQWTETKRRESETIQRLKKEAEGLEQRIRNLQSNLKTRQQELAKSQITLPDLSSSMNLVGRVNPKLPLLETQEWVVGEFHEYLALLDGLSCTLADERLRLICQVEQLVEARKHWEEEHAAGIQELKTRCHRLDEDERAWENRTLILRKQQSEVHQTRQSLESWQARVTIQAANWKAERERLLAQIQSLENRTTRLSEILGDLPSDWNDRIRQGDPEIIQKHRDALAEAEYARLRQELDSLRGQRAAYENQVAELTAEVERLAKLMLEESEPVHLATAKAA